MPATPWAHFEKDAARAKALQQLGAGLPSRTDVELLLRDDILRSAWMFVVGAMDAYFCDAYISFLTLALRAKSLQASVVLPDFVRNVEIPIGAILEPYTRKNWRWRMAIRAKMEKDNVLQPEKIRTLFNPFFPEGQGKKLFTEVAGVWISHRDSTARVFGITAAAYAGLPAGNRPAADKRARDQVQNRVRAIIQRRHDCIHNCDRPRVSPQAIHSPGTVGNVIRDVCFFTGRCNEHFDSEFPGFLDRIGCTGVTKNALVV